MSFVEGLKAIPGDILSKTTPGGRLRRVGEIGKILVDELTGVIKTIPYGIRALRQHKKLPDACGPARDTGGHTVVSIARNVRYADSPRAVMDVYLPKGVCLSDEFALDTDGRVIKKVVDAVDGVVAGSDGNAAKTPAKTPAFPTQTARTTHTQTAQTTPTETITNPIALFIHGGVWAVGEKWQFAPMAHRLAQEGVITCIATYSLFPTAKCPQMWEEVSDALTWTMDHAHLIGGCEKQVVLVGHSAGAQICAMALMHRQGMGNDVNDATDAATDAATDDINKTKKEVDSRQPRAFVGLCGVYDIATHFSYEDSRGVAAVSTMGRAMGGKGEFAKCSPLRVVRNNLFDLPDFSDSTCESAESTAAAADEVSIALDSTQQLHEKGAIKRMDWAPMGIMDTDENISIGDIFAESAAKKAEIALATKTKQDELDAAEARVVEAQNEASAAASTATASTSTSDSVCRIRRDAPPPGPYVGAFAGDEPARQAGYGGGTADDELGTSAVAGTQQHRRPGCFPPSYLLAGCADTTVPWFESAEYHLALRDSGAKSRMLLYLNEPHASFVLGWRPRKEKKGEKKTESKQTETKPSKETGRNPHDFWNDGLDHSSSGLAPHCADIVRVIKSA